MEGKRHCYSEKRKGFCPEQIPMCINNIQVRKYCRQLYATKNYTGLKELNDCFAIVRRAIMRRYRDEEAHIDESIIRAIESIPVTEEEINASSVYAVARMPVSTNYFDSDIWTIIFREMLPVDEKIEFTHNVFTILLAIFITVTIAEVSLLRKKLTALRNRDRAKGIDDLKRSGKLNGSEINKLDKNLNDEFYASFNSLKDDMVYNMVDDFREYMSCHNVADFTDKKVVMIWRIVTCNVFIMPTSLADVRVIDHSLFSIYSLHNDPYDYTTAISIIRSTFYGKYKDYKNENATQEIWEEWKERYMYIKILSTMLSFRMSKHNASDISEVDTSYIKLLKMLHESTFAPYNRWVTGRRYSEIELEPEYGTEQINLMLNKLHEGLIEYTIVLSSIYNKNHFMDTIIKKCVSENIEQAKFYIPVIVSIKCEKSYIKDVLIKHKANTDMFWCVYMILLLKGLLSDDFSQELNDVYESITALEDKAMFIKGFWKAATYTKYKDNDLMNWVIENGKQLLEQQMHGSIKIDVIDAVTELGKMLD